MSTLAIVAICMLYSCKKDAALQGTNNGISQDVLAKIAALGFGTSKVEQHPEGYLVEGDIVLTNELLNQTNDQTLLRIANTEQYRTTNLVKGLPRVITIGVSSRLPSRYIIAADGAIARYNAENLQLTFVRVSSHADITINKAAANAGYLASAGFPTKHGKPYQSISVNSTYLDNNSWPMNTVISILAHEAGHCIGFRHTDYMDRSFSCGGSPVNEGAGNIGAIHIPGTPTGPDRKSWMLSCIGKNDNRPFNNNDQIALDYLY